MLFIMERTLALIKPDAVRASRLRDIQQLIALAGFTVLDERTIWVRHGISYFYYLHVTSWPMAGQLGPFLSLGRMTMEHPQRY